MNETFRIVAMSSINHIGADYIDQKTFDTYDDALERGKELLKHYPAFRVEKLYQV